MTKWTCASAQPCKDHVCAIAEGEEKSELGHSSWVLQSHSTDLASVFPFLDIFQGTSIQARCCKFRKYSITARAAVGSSPFTFFFLINNASHRDVSWSRKILFWWLFYVFHISGLLRWRQRRRSVNWCQEIEQISTNVKKKRLMPTTQPGYGPFNCCRSGFTLRLPIFHQVFYEECHKKRNEKAALVWA